MCPSELHQGEASPDDPKKRAKWVVDDVFPYWMGSRDVRFLRWLRFLHSCIPAFLLQRRGAAPSLTEASDCCRTRGSRFGFLVRRRAGP